MAEGGVLAIQMRRILMHDEELGACGIRVHGARHGDHAALVLDGVRDAVHREFALDAVTRSAHAGAVRAAALDHKARDDAVKREAVIIALVRQGKEVLHGVRSCGSVEFELDNAAIFHFNDDHNANSPL